MSQAAGLSGSGQTARQIVEEVLAEAAEVKVSLDTVETTATVMFIVAAASIFGWMLTATGVTAQIAREPGNADLIFKRAELERAGAAWTEIEGQQPEEILAAATDCDALLVVSSKVPAVVIERLTRCRWDAGAP